MAIAAVNGATASSAAGVTSLALAATSLTAANDIVIAVCIITTTVSVSSITDTAGNTYTQKTAGNNSTNVREEVWTSHNVTGNGSNVVTVNFSGSTACAIASEQYSGVNAIGNTGTSTGTNQYPNASALTQNASDFVVVGIAIAGASTDTISANTGNLRQSIVDAGGGTIPEVAIVDNTSLGIVTVRGDVKSNVTNRPWAAGAVNLRTSVTGATENNYTGTLPIMNEPSLGDGTTNVDLRYVKMPSREVPAVSESPSAGQIFPNKQ
jgi:hypothetical protein